jgi:16S rRNA (guanine527-N7)-methyltransferase
MDERSGSGSGETLEQVLEDSRRYGFLGPGPLAPQIEHARGFASTRERAPGSFLDMGSGGGLPGLVLALEWPDARGVLLDAMAKRVEFLRDACIRLGLDDRIEVVGARAEDAAREPVLRGRFDLVTARSFGPPAVTAECAAGFLAPGGALIVSEPPEDDARRWPVDGLAELGMVLEPPPTPALRFVTIRRSTAVPERYPRRVGVPGKRPLWT